MTDQEYLAILIDARKSNKAIIACDHAKSEQLIGYVLKAHAVIERQIKAINAASKAKPAGKGGAPAK